MKNIVVSLLFLWLNVKAKVKPWIEWTLQSQREDEYFGPVTPIGGYEPEPGIQQRWR